MSKLVDTAEVIVGILIIIAGILAVIYLLSPEFQRRVNIKAAEIGAPNE